MIPFVLVFCAYGLAGNAQRILVDGEFEDWRGLEPAHTDPADAPGRGLELGRLWVANDEHYLFLRLEAGREISLQGDNGLTLYLDSDDDARTGRPVAGIGADLTWWFGKRKGVFEARGSQSVVEHQNIGLVTAPTTTGDEFEIALARRARPTPHDLLFPSPRIRLVLVDEDGGDRLPDGDAAISYSFDDADLEPLKPIELEKWDPSHIRVLSYNVNDHLRDPGRRQALQRILRAIRPDLMLWQEVRSDEPDDAALYLSRLADAPLDQWHYEKAGGESTLLISPYPIVSVHPLGNSAAFVVDWPAADPDSLLIVGLSVPCCDQERERQEELDAIAAFIRDAKEPGGDLALAEGTPILAIGDANLVGDARQRQTLLAGSIADETTYGASAGPDWDGSPLTDIKPRHTHRHLTFTWFGEDFPPGRLDVAYYSDSVLQVGNHFVLHTPGIPRRELSRLNLRSQDTRIATDHLPLVVDLVPPSGVGR